MQQLGKPIQTTSQPCSCLTSLLPVGLLGLLCDAAPWPRPLQASLAQMLDRNWSRETLPQMKQQIPSEAALLTHLGEDAQSQVNRGARSKSLQGCPSLQGYSEPVVCQVLRTHM